jgi:signal transduction histidine kinase
MTSLLDDLLDVSRITRGSFVLKRSRIDVKNLLKAAMESVQPAIDAKRHTLRVEIPEVPITLEADPVRLTRVFTNLLANAAKYTPAGGLITAGGVGRNTSFRWLKADCRPHLESNSQFPTTTHSVRPMEPNSA